MADDDIERLLREVAATTGGTPAPTPGAAVSRPDDRSPASTARRSTGRLAFAGISAVGLGAAAWCLGLVLPFTSAFSAGVGGAFAAFVTALVAGPPRWFSN